MLETILRCDTERTELLQEEARLLASMNSADQNGATDQSKEGSQGKIGKQVGAVAPDPEASAKLEKVIYVREAF